MSEETPEEVKVHVITWMREGQKWYLDSWGPVVGLPDQQWFSWSKTIATAQGFESGELAIKFWLENLGQRKTIDLEEVPHEDFGIVFDLSDI